MRGNSRDAGAISEKYQNDVEPRDQAIVDEMMRTRAQQLAADRQAHQSNVHRSKGNRGASGSSSAMKAMNRTIADGLS